MIEPRVKPAEPAPTASVDVIIPSHNYGRFLRECVSSVRRQTLRPASITIVNDSSTDDTQAVAAELGVKCININAGNVFITRKTGFEATESEFVVFLDADDMLAPTYLAECVAVAQQDESIGIVNSDLQHFGGSSRVVCHRNAGIDRANYIHAGALARRLALQVSGAYELPTPPVSTHADWYVWRHVVRHGWKVGKIANPSYLYRQHGQSMMSLRGPGHPYYEEASLACEPVTLVLPLAGRAKFFDQLAEWTEAQSRVTDLVVIDSSSDKFYKARLHAWLSSLRFRSIRLVNLPPSNGLADTNRAADRDLYRAVQRAMPRIYEHIRTAPTEYLMIVEDDVLPPVDAIERLMHSMGHNVAAVSGMVPSRWNTAQAIACDMQQVSIPLTADAGGVQELGGTGFGCLLLRRSVVLESTPFHNGGRTQNYDIEFSRRARELGFKWLMDWRVKCRHG